MPALYQNVIFIISLKYIFYMVQSISYKILTKKKEQRQTQASSLLWIERKMLHNQACFNSTEIEHSRKIELSFIEKLTLNKWYFDFFKWKRERNLKIICMIATEYLSGGFSFYSSTDICKTSSWNASASINTSFIKIVWEGPGVYQKMSVTIVAWVQKRCKNWNQLKWSEILNFCRGW